MENDAAAYRDILEDMTDGVYFVDTQRRIRLWNAAAERITGYSAPDVIGKSCFDNILLHVDDDGMNLCEEGCPLFDTIRDGRKRTMNLYFHHRDGHRVPVRITASRILGEDGGTLGAKEVFHVIAPHEMERERATGDTKAAGIDSLTGLPGRETLERWLFGALDDFDEQGIPFGVIMVMIENYNRIEKKHGRPAADEVVRMTGRTLAGNIHADDIFGRWDGTAFLGIISDIDDRLLGRIRKKLTMLANHSYIEREGGRIGADTFVAAATPEEDDTIESIIGRLEKAAGRTPDNTDGAATGKRFVRKRKQRHDIPPSSGRLVTFIKDCRILHPSLELVVIIMMILIGLMIFLSLNHIVNF